MDIKIEKNVPMPKRTRHGATAATPVASMNVGDSFFLPDTKSTTAHGYLWHWKKKLNTKYTVRLLTESGVEGVRIWRVK